jgi:2-keto-3-deoxy-L-rhamnonate aldolase RhmA
MIETAAALTDVNEICAVPGLSGIYVGPADLAISMGVEVMKATSHPAVRDAIARIEHAASAAGLVPGIHAGDGKVGHAMAQLGFQMITLASESQALRRGAAAGLREATAQDAPTGSSPAGGYR